MGTKNFSNANDLITFSRASGGTALRKVAYGPELVTNGDFSTDSDWTKQSAWTISDGQASYDDSGLEYIQSTTAFELTAGKTYEISYEIISGSVPVIGFLNDTASVNLLGAYQFPSTGINKAVFSPSSTVNGIRIYGNNSGSSFVLDNVSVKEVLFDDASGDLTLLNHPADVPRIEYDADGNVLGLLVEESRTNLLTYSEDFTDASWAKVGLTSTTKDQAGPDGVLSGYTLLANTSSLSYVSLGFTVSTSTKYTFSVFAKAGTEDWIALNIRNNTTVSDGVRYFDVASGALGVAAGSTLDGASIEDVGNGWYRCSVTFTSDAADTTASLRIYVAEGNGDAITNDGTESVIIYGAQLEAGAFPTSYIPTAGATATRSADVASIPVADFGYNQSEGTVVVEGQTIESNADSRFFTLSDGTNNNRISFSRGSTYHPYVATGGAAQASLAAGTVNAGTLVKAAAAFRQDDIAGVIDGGSVATDTSAAIPSVNKLYLAAAATGLIRGACHIKSIKYYPRRLTNAQLQELTT